MAILTVGTGVSITVGVAPGTEYADETTEYELSYDEESADPVPFLDGHSEIPPTATGGRAWTLKLTGARSEITGSLYDYLWINDGQPGDFVITDQGATYTFSATIKPAPAASSAGEANMFEVELPLSAPPERVAAPAAP